MLKTLKSKFKFYWQREPAACQGKSCSRLHWMCLEICCVWFVLPFPVQADMCGVQVHLCPPDVCHARPGVGEGDAVGVWCSHGVLCPVHLRPEGGVVWSGSHHCCNLIIFLLSLFIFVFLVKLTENYCQNCE